MGGGVGEGVVTVGVARPAPNPTGTQDHEAGPPDGGIASMCTMKGESKVEGKAKRPWGGGFGCGFVAQSR